MEGAVDTHLFAFDSEKERPNAIFAIPKKGRLFEKAMKLLEGAGLEHHRPPRLDVAHCTGLPVTLVFLPAADIASYVGEGNVDLGITGIDVVEESNVDVTRVLDLGFGGCKLCLQAPVASAYKGGADVAGKRIVTSFPNLARKYFDKFDTPGKPTSIKYVSGSVEAACGLGLADAVVDLVETGTTMMAAGLHAVDTVLETEAILISSKTSSHPDIVELIKTRITGYMTATSYMLISYNCNREDLSSCLKITPGKRSPTVSQLDNNDGVAVQALVKKKESSRVMDELQRAGATDILLFSISNSRM
jgi:ATP phosphoribosyltransferase